MGDEVMVSGQVRELQRTDPRKVRIFYERGPRWYSVWANNPRIAQPGERGDFNDWCPRVNHLRPYIAAKSKKQWTWKAYRPPAGELYFTDAERAYAAQYPLQVVIDIDIKAGASPNKQWGRHNWEQLAKLLMAEGIPIYQMGPLPPLMMTGATFTKTETIRHAAALIANSKAVICHEGALHHIAAAVGTPVVVIYGGYISPAVTGYDGQEALFTGEGLGCGMRVPCQHCAEAMAAIKPEHVMEALRKALNGRSPERQSTAPT
jgi:ADP-heptose:LPS heptosyltransferase